MARKLSKSLRKKYDDEFTIGHTLLGSPRDLAEPLGEFFDIATWCFDTSTEWSDDAESELHDRLIASPTNIADLTYFLYFADYSYDMLNKIGRVGASAEEKAEVRAIVARLDRMTTYATFILLDAIYNIVQPWHTEHAVEDPGFKYCRAESATMMVYNSMAPNVPRGQMWTIPRQDVLLQIMNTQGVHADFADACTQHAMREYANSLRDNLYEWKQAMPNPSEEILGFIDEANDIISTIEGGYINVVATYFRLKEFWKQYADELTQMDADVGGAEMGGKGDYATNMEFFMKVYSRGSATNHEQEVMNFALLEFHDLYSTDFGEMGFESEDFQGGRVLAAEKAAEVISILLYSAGDRRLEATDEMCLEAITNVFAYWLNNIHVNKVSTAEASTNATKQLLRHLVPLLEEMSITVEGRHELLSGRSLKEAIAMANAAVNLLHTGGKLLEDHLDDQTRDDFLQCNVDSPRPIVGGWESLTGWGDNDGEVNHDLLVSSVLHDSYEHRARLHTLLTSLSQDEANWRRYHVLVFRELFGKELPLAYWAIFDGASVFKTRISRFLFKVR